jgi:adenylate cyclase
MPLRALIVDDDALFRTTLTDPFASAGYQVETAANGATAARFAVTNPPDVAIIDLILPDFSGFQVLATFRANVPTRDVPLIVVTGSSDRAALIQAFRMGADDVMFKPVEVSELLERCRVAIERRAAARVPTPSPSSVLMRRDLAALFCDVRGFTKVAATMDPESMVQVLNGLFHSIVGDVIRHGGTVDKFIGDGMLALFGAHDSGGQNELRAIQCGLDIVKSAEAYGKESLTLKSPIGVGVGIASGGAVVGMVGARTRFEMTAIGDAVNLAARLQALAHEGEVLIDAITYERAARSLDVGAPRSQEIKGFGERVVYPINAIRADGWFH